MTAGVRVPVPGGGAYPVRVEPGVLDRLGELCAEELSPHRAAVVADDRVAELYGDRAVASLERAGIPAELLTFPAGEASKTRATWARLTDRMLAAGLGRDAAVVALGGGVTGDLAGFVAATYLRGVPVVQAPTSLLAMVDAAVGGKTAVDTDRGKNLVGAFHHPALVAADPEVLETLSAAQREAGLAEAVKTAAVADAELFAWTEEAVDALAAGESEPVARLVQRCMEIKADVVARDPGESGLRQVLNFGHTVGHALEARSGWHLLHGHAVAAGMRAEARLGESLGVTEPGTADRLTRLLAACGHDDRPEAGLTPAGLMEAAAADKKARRGRVRFVLLEAVGEVARTEDGAWSRPLPGDREEELLEAALRPNGRRADSSPD